MAELAYTMGCGYFTANCQSDQGEKPVWSLCHT